MGIPTNKKKPLRKQELGQESDQEKRKTRTRPRKRIRKQELDQEKKKKTFFFLDHFLSRVLVFFIFFVSLLSCFLLWILTSEEEVYKTKKYKKPKNNREIKIDWGCKWPGNMASFEVAWCNACSAGTTEERMKQRKLACVVFLHFFFFEFLSFLPFFIYL